MGHSLLLGWGTHCYSSALGFLLSTWPLTHCQCFSILHCLQERDVLWYLQVFLSVKTLSSSLKSWEIFSVFHFEDLGFWGSFQIPLLPPFCRQLSGSSCVAQHLVPLLMLTGNCYTAFCSDPSVSWSILCGVWGSEASWIGLSRSSNLWCSHPCPSSPRAVSSVCTICTWCPFPEVPQSTNHDLFLAGHSACSL